MAIPEANSRYPYFYVGRPDYVRPQTAEVLAERVRRELDRPKMKALLDEYEANLRFQAEIAENGQIYNQIMIVLQAETEDEVIQQAFEVCFDLSLATNLNEIESSVKQPTWTLRQLDGNHELALIIYRDFSFEGEKLPVDNEIDLLSQQKAKLATESKSEQQPESITEDEQLNQKLQHEALMIGAMYGRVMYLDDIDDRSQFVAEVQEEVDAMLDELQISEMYRPVLTTQQRIVGGKYQTKIILTLSGKNDEEVEAEAHRICDTFMTEGASPEVIGCLKRYHDDSFYDLPYNPKTKRYTATITLYQDYLDSTELKTRHGLN